MFIGIDEAGKGCVLGSLYIAIAAVESEDKLKGLGLADSKKLKPETREKLFKKLIIILDYYEVRSISPQEIDAGNLLTLEANYTKQLLETYLKQNFSESNKAYIDCPHPVPAKYKKMIEVPSVEIITEHKADNNYLTCMAASILAKVSRDQALKEHGIKCSGYPGDIHTAKFLESLYPNFPNYVRMSWKTTRNLIARKQAAEEVDLV